MKSLVDNGATIPVPSVVLKEPLRSIASCGNYFDYFHLSLNIKSTMYLAKMPNKQEIVTKKFKNKKRDTITHA